MTKTLLNAVVVTTTSAGENVEELTNLSLHFFATGISSGNGALTVEGSNDGTNWLGIVFHDATQTAGATNVSSLTLSSNVSALALVPSGFKMIRTVVTRTTDGTYSVILHGQKAR